MVPGRTFVIYDFVDDESATRHQQNSIGQLQPVR